MYHFSVIRGADRSTMQKSIVSFENQLKLETYFK